ncbi:MAG: hypothetical protein QOD12_2389 [Verrucomicrobiota bacterium]|jgi:hypothetical protein
MKAARSYGWAAWIALPVAVAGIIFLRAPEMVLAPALLFDEGAKVFAYFYEHRDTVELVRFKSGYVPLIGNLIGYLAVRLPTRAIPYAFVSSAVLIATFAYSLFFLRSFRRWVPSDLERALICVLFALAPLSDCLLVTMSDYSTWNLLGALVLLTLSSPPAPRTWRYLHAFVCHLLVWSHPLTILITPVVVWYALKDKQHRTFYHVLLFNLVVHQVFGVAGVVTMQGLWEHGGKLHIGLVSQFLHSCLWTGQIIGATAFRTAFGSPLFEWAVRERPSLLFAWMAVVVAGCYVVARRIPRFRALLAFTGYLIIGLTFLSCFLRYEDIHDDPIAFIIYSPRYIYLQSLCFLLLFGTALASGWELGFLFLRERNQVIRRSLSQLTLLPLAALLCHYYILNTQFGHYFVTNTQRASPYYDPDARNGVIVREFFSRLAGMEQRLGSRKGIQLTADKVNDWPITIDTATPSPPTTLRLSHRARVFAVSLALVALAYCLRRIWAGRRSGRMASL